MVLETLRLFAVTEKRKLWEVEAMRLEIDRPIGDSLGAADRYCRHDVSQVANMNNDDDQHGVMDRR